MVFLSGFPMAMLAITWSGKRKLHVHQQEKSPDIGDLLIIKITIPQCGAPKSEIVVFCSPTERYHKSAKIVPLNLYVSIFFPMVFWHS